MSDRSFASALDSTVQLYSVYSALAPHGLSFCCIQKRCKIVVALSHENMIGGEGMVWSTFTPNRVCRCSVLTRRAVFKHAIRSGSSVVEQRCSTWIIIFWSFFFLFSRSAVHCTIVQEWNASPSKAWILMHKVWPRLGDWVNRPPTFKRSAYFPYETRVQG